MGFRLQFSLLCFLSIGCAPKESSQLASAEQHILSNPNSCEPPGEVRKNMDRCEGFSYPLPGLAWGVYLASYTIGQPQIPDEGRMGFDVPDEPGSDPLNVKVKARRGVYQMTPFRLGESRKGWTPFEWGVGMLSRYGIRSDELRATARLSKSGGEVQWLPVRFAPANSYSLVISGDSGLALAHVRIVGPDKKLVKECSGPIQLDGDLLCTWDGRNNSAGIYSLIAPHANDPAKQLNLSLRHNPKWLER